MRMRNYKDGTENSIVYKLGAKIFMLRKLFIDN